MSPRHRLVATLVVALAALSGCALGQRPTLAEERAIGAPVGDPAIDAVLAQLADVDDASFTAEYQITNNFGQITRPATVVHTADGHRSITIGDVRFLIEGPQVATCNLAAFACTDVIDDAAVSDLQVTHQFYSRSAAARLRNDANRRVGPAEGYTAEIGGTTATCVGVPIDGGTVSYCATDTGPLASYQGPDVLITLSSLSDAVDDAAFQRIR